MTDEQHIEETRKPSNYFASIGINVLLVVLYFRFLWTRNGVLGLVAIYVVASLICLFVYRLRGKIFLVDVILGSSFLAGMLYALWYEKSWYLMAEIVMTTIVMFSVTYYYFDWKKLDERAGKQEASQ